MPLNNKMSSHLELLFLLLSLHIRSSGQIKKELLLKTALNH